MTRPKQYNTKQQEALLKYIDSLEGKHFTAAEIATRFKEQMGRTTVYRLLDKLSESGQVRKFITDGKSGACFQQAKSHKECGENFHLKCESCGELQHLESKIFAEIKKYIMGEHHFCIDTTKTVLYGTCEQCGGKRA